MTVFQFVHSTTPADSKKHKGQVRAHAARNRVAVDRRVAAYQASRKSKVSRRLDHQPDLVVNNHGLASCLSAANTDPFQSFSRPVAQHEWFLLHYFISHLAQYRTSCFAEQSHDCDGPYQLQQFMVPYWIRSAASDAGFLACILLAACRDLSRWVGAGDRGSRYDALSAQYSINAIRSLREALASSSKTVSDSMILTCMAIGLDAHLTGDSASVVMHAEALSRMVRLRGGFAAMKAEGTLKNMSIWSLNGPATDPLTFHYLHCVVRFVSVDEKLQDTPN
ncbi:uncharacterized protein F5Z01DRAFT_674426 [Emericellopsis atlantica]|uniref:Uncharacterized protein n=1 Tax=Emericellopsis atlantica TaxID=2614577 RepID=A0A9P7ZLB2_9HYPO|nr:uncharacterized protein F5Z01DRAFT_674426 [Emericellopsis atlantica]KAG9254110.1 hypothetical protein F5Z01DRAFT_674426 [Emericellopsis atlantica]